jgi:hypothetical protein
VQPHSLVHLEVTNADGTKTEWIFETVLPRQLARAPKDGGMEIGQTYTVDGFAAKNGKPMGFLKTVTFPDGKSVTTWFGDPNG